MGASVRPRSSSSVVQPKERIGATTRDSSNLRQPGGVLKAFHLYGQCRRKESPIQCGCVECSTRPVVRDRRLVIAGCHLVVNRGQNRANLGCFWATLPTEMPIFVNNLDWTAKTAKPLSAGSIPARASILPDKLRNSEVSLSLRLGTHRANQLHGLP